MRTLTKALFLGRVNVTLPGSVERPSPVRWKWWRGSIDFSLVLVYARAFGVISNPHTWSPYSPMMASSNEMSSPRPKEYTILSLPRRQSTSKVQPPYLVGWGLAERCRD
jgi:hypothetical protein